MRGNQEQLVERMLDNGLPDETVERETGAALDDILSIRASAASAPSLDRGGRRSAAAKPLRPRRPG